MDYSKLRGRILEVYKTQEAFAKAMSEAGTKISLCTLNKKLNGRTEWTTAEIHCACSLLGIEAADIPIYFFCVKSLEIQANT